MSEYYYVCFHMTTYDGRKLFGTELIDKHPLRWANEVKEVTTITFWKEISKEIWEEFKELLENE